MATKKTSTKATKPSAKEMLNDTIESIKTEVDNAVSEIKQEAAEKKAAAKKSSTKKVTENVYIQQDGNEVSTSEMIAKAKEMSGVKNPKNIDVYVRPEINMVYYVVDGENFGNFELF